MGAVAELSVSVSSGSGAPVILAVLVSVVPSPAVQGTVNVKVSVAGVEGRRGSHDR
ncbi:hypothetical protein ACIHFD_12180 [Nonomuraea sp. NPDC051941]|uniref:hypothetical protein n=1 Tax=Nonomuraea sp. NPDC051941 TaxID=3364373 RepID=UPI0037C6352F